MTTETTVNLNAHEVGVILSALQLLETGDEHRISVEYGSASALYNRMYEVFDTMDTENLTLDVETYIEPSF